MPCWHKCLGSEYTVRRSPTHLPFFFLSSLPAFLICFLRQDLAMQQSSCLSLSSAGLAGCHLPYLAWLLNPLFSLWVPTAQLEERAEQIRSKSYLIQVEREKMQMELSHKRTRVELERAASTNARNYEVGRASPRRRRAMCCTCQTTELGPSCCGQGPRAFFCGQC